MARTQQRRTTVAVDSPAGGATKAKRTRRRTSAAKASTRRSRPAGTATSTHLIPANRLEDFWRQYGGLCANYGMTPGRMHGFIGQQLQSR